MAVDEPSVNQGMGAPLHSEEPPLLEIEGLSKTFPGVRALDAVSLKLYKGQIHGLIGHNGSGKSTLTKVLAGYHAADPRSVIEYQGRPVTHEQLTAGDHIRVMHQDLGLVDTLSVTENLCLTRGYHTGRMGRIQWRMERTRVAQLLHSFGVDVDPKVPLGRLGAATKSIVGLARSLQDWNPTNGILILDEPTAALARPEVDSLFEAVRRVAERGAGVIFVSHRLEEVDDLCSWVTALRDGKVTASQSTAVTSHDDLTRFIVGPATVTESARPVRQTSSVSRVQISEAWGMTVEGVTFDVAEGEIVGIAGLVGSGREEMAALLTGSSKPVAGVIRVEGERLATDASGTSRQGVTIVPADRRRQAIFPRDSLARNITLNRQARPGSPFWITEKAERAQASTWIANVNIQPKDPRALMGTLSGGNQQKSVISRCLRNKPRVIVLDEPTQGVDVGARSAIYRLLEEEASLGTSVILCSSDSEELSRVCDRVLIFVHGRQVCELVGAQVKQSTIDEMCLQR